jgi:RNase P subunit RPR2
MSILRYRCPNTSNEVVTGIDTDAPRLAKMRDLKVSVACEHCPDGHRVPADTMYFGPRQMTP